MRPYLRLIAVIYLLAFGLGNSRTAANRIEVPDSAQWGDMMLDPDGNSIVSDGKPDRIYRYRKGHWQRLDKGAYISPPGIELLHDLYHPFDHFVENSGAG